MRITLKIKRYFKLVWKFKRLWGLERLQRKWKSRKDRRRRRRQRQRFFAEHPFCNFCKRKDNLTIDHIIPLSRGGKKSMSNWQVLCRKCNNKKGNKMIF